MYLVEVGWASDPTKLIALQIEACMKKQTDKGNTVLGWRQRSMWYLYGIMVTKESQHPPEDKRVSLVDTPSHSCLLHDPRPLHLAWSGAQPPIRLFWPLTEAQVLHVWISEYLINTQQWWGRGFWRRRKMMIEKQSGAPDKSLWNSCATQS